MSALVDKSLVAREPEVLGQARYRLLDSIREYAASHAEEAGENGGPSSAGCATTPSGWAGTEPGPRAWPRCL